MTIRYKKIEIDGENNKCQGELNIDNKIKPSGLIK